MLCGLTLSFIFQARVHANVRLNVARTRTQSVAQPAVYQNIGME